MKAVRGWTLARSLPILNFCKYPPLFFPVFVSQTAYKNAVQFDNTLGEEKLLQGAVEAWSCMGLNRIVLLAPIFSY